MYLSRICDGSRWLVEGAGCVAPCRLTEGGWYLRFSLHRAGWWREAGAAFHFQEPSEDFWLTEDQDSGG